MARNRTTIERSSRPATRLRAQDVILPAIATLAVFLLFLCVFGPAHHDAAVLKARGVDVTGTVMGITLHPGSGRSSSSFHLHYRFPVAGGWVKGTRILRGGEEDRVRGRQEVPIIYDPQDPSRSTLNFGDAVQRGHPDAEFILGLIAAAVAVASFWWLFLSLPRLRAAKTPDGLWCQTMRFAAWLRGR